MLRERSFSGALPFSALLVAVGPDGALRFEGGDFVLVLEGERNRVESLHDAAAAEGVEREGIVFPAASTVMVSSDTVTVMPGFA